MSKIKIDVQGTHTITHPAERAVVHARLSLEGPEPERVYAAAAASAAEVRGQIEARHNPDAGPATSFSIDQVRTYSHRPYNSSGVQLPLVFTASVEFEVEFSGFEALEEWARLVSSIKGFSIDHVDWRLSEPVRVDLERQARHKSLLHARSVAQDYADALDLGSVEVSAVRAAHGSRDVIEPMAFRAMATEAMGPADEPVLKPGRVEIASTVNATFVVRT